LIDQILAEVLPRFLMDYYKRLHSSIVNSKDQIITDLSESKAEKEISILNLKDANEDLMKYVVINNVVN